MSWPARWNSSGAWLRRSPTRTRRWRGGTTSRWAGWVCGEVGGPGSASSLVRSSALQQGGLSSRSMQLACASNEFVCWRCRRAARRSRCSARSKSCTDTSPHRWGGAALDRQSDRPRSALRCDVLYHSCPRYLPSAPHKPTNPFPPPSLTPCRPPRWRLPRRSATPTRCLLRSSETWPRCGVGGGGEEWGGGVRGERA